MYYLMHLMCKYNNSLNNIPIEENTKRKLRYFFTARDGDDDTHYSTDCHDGNTPIDQLDTSPDFRNVRSPPSVLLAGRANMFRDPANASIAVPSQYNYRQGDHPYVLTQSANMDVDVFPVEPGTAQQFYHPEPSGFPQPPLQQFDGNFYQQHYPHDPSPYHSYINGGMPHVTNVGPSAQQYHGHTSESYISPQTEPHHPPYIYPLPYGGHPPVSTLQHQNNHNSVYQRNPMHDVEMMAKVVPWGDASPAMPSTRISARRLGSTIAR